MTSLHPTHSYIVSFISNVGKSINQSYYPLQMDSRSFLFSLSRLFSPFLLLILILTTSRAFPDYGEWFLNCSNSKGCMSVPDNEPPLWSNIGEETCGGNPQTMNVNCDGGGREIIEIEGRSYQLLGYSIKDQILIIAEIDHSAWFCSNHAPSISIYAMIHVSYHCGHPHTPDKPTCPGSEFIHIPLDKRTSFDGFCSLSTEVKISPSLLNENHNDLKRVAQHIIEELKATRKVKSNAECGNCSVPGAVYSYDLQLHQPKCCCKTSPKVFEFCPSPPAGSPQNDDAPKTAAPPPEATKTKKTATEKGIIIGASVGGAFLVATILGFCIFFCLGKKKKKHPVGYVSKEAALSPPVSDPLSDKDMPPAPLLNSFQTHSIPSYPSSKSDLERPSPNSDIQVFSYAELEKATQNFNRSRELGDGGFGTVYYGKLDDGREVAVKRLYEHNCKRVEQFMNEVNILADLQHKNLVKLYGCTSKFSQGLLLVYEYIPNGTVADHLHGSRVKFGLLSWPIRLRIAIETANALIYLHRKDIIHRDVKTNNILLDSTCTIKVADFGLSRLFPTDVTHVSTAPQGTPGYVDPEYYQCYQLTTKSDVYSFGVVLIELISSLRAVDTDRKRQDINLSNMAVSKIQNRALNELIDPKLGFDKNPEVMRATTSVAELAFRCLQQERDMRPSMEEVVEVLREIENDKSSSEMSKVVDTGVVEDDIEITKRTPPAFSPNSVIDDNWVSSSTITNSL
ncbi:LEAF RUST 10 DISEASE-RESISTANCE LOCUS RECEPTOR-LIKE PROTEIN KINASE-like 1.4 isoform X2 [Cucurbita pepo subsp. pepo]|uniref:LEAF RUST 10 DISEASE-RESISTANCE LOCUS RECEPTOR-LIKE PROTEIN KINASE-like 1.4 isoform X2 n=1 Tax=Cucurbita pepo subsp. pepo TaxID=3664 RepID=UPI000C9D9DF3|nr:LEAF RUST 10 DISEASE-RESISTANCE LOCUS RECEPTOR-LIKE PROTEIN KINASE-like 1.4 isoform X2 [Cucurbita pepo subsp. pepo]